ncbi:hypothetical protein FNU76_19060 [Chitinimonas arctica]|uniref:Uncharacterized protein n=1 Tax=Chitinimonas arctica TaxID=2594795 RepID=A0A516SJF6_9NEIS|nr:hypothetical protein [Chitinimonas arctica]QDQ28280.1 hypothetical protein FNU76_19060 [Chitinimonas arctica]
MSPDCRRCAELSAFANCGAILRGRVCKADGTPYLPGALAGPPNPTAWAVRCGAFTETGYAVSLPKMGPQWA